MFRWTGSPLALRIFDGANGAILLLAVYSVMRFRMKRRAAYAGGRETRGTACLRHVPGEDDSAAHVMFANNHTEWLMSIERGRLKGLKDRLPEGIKATAYLGEDDRIYGLDYAFEDKLKERIERAEQRFRSGAGKRSGSALSKVERFHLPNRKVTRISFHIGK
ncbi:hypothetical protein QQS45_08620 [Alteriqipengyuania flavescens]|uniref:hypothetical protein n=1 Tax=Alteriqipengyuania flavescens TaxID=3053610 RepID=UPI0025B328E4|nr:hypothetical protein [Alteriqipengyuania flavescens]WJY17709.1 hypothetical protein QQW98_08615 [Alteriqipengyuania flavescens]WJY23652.1 hypothetical protein QQS45_08620 [Alteriqipengyuania flavescens]